VLNLKPLVVIVFLCTV